MTDQTCTHCGQLRHEGPHHEDSPDYSPDLSDHEFERTIESSPELENATRKAFDNPVDELEDAPDETEALQSALDQVLGMAPAEVPRKEGPVGSTAEELHIGLEGNREVVAAHLRQVFLDAGGSKEWDILLNFNATTKGTTMYLQRVGGGVAQCYQIKTHDTVGSVESQVAEWATKMLV